MKLIVATRNTHKSREMGEILGGGAEVLNLRDLAFPGDIPEDGKTFDENARIKLLALLAHLRQSRFCANGPAWAVADDSGLEVDELGGAPGVYSARYAGEPSDDARNNTRLLETLRAVPDGRRGAQFRCVLAAAIFSPSTADDGSAPPPIRFFQGICRGRIGHAPSGGGGFGYDPLFIPDGFACTFAELGAEQKNSLSHRGKAMAAFRAAAAR